MHSVRVEPTKSILVGTRITYQDSGDAGDICKGSFFLHPIPVKECNELCIVLKYLFMPVYVSHLPQVIKFVDLTHPLSALTLDCLLKK